MADPTPQTSHSKGPTSPSSTSDAVRSLLWEARQAASLEEKYEMGLLTRLADALEDRERRLERLEGLLREASWEHGGCLRHPAGVTIRNVGCECANCRLADVIDEGAAP